MNFFRAGTILYLADLVQITIHEMRYDTYHDTLQLNENMNKGLKFIESVYVLPHVQSDFIIFKMNVEQFTNYFRLVFTTFHKQVIRKFSTLQI